MKLRWRKLYCNEERDNKSVRETYRVRPNVSRKCDKAKQSSDVDITAGEVAAANRFCVSLQSARCFSFEQEFHLWVLLLSSTHATMSIKDNSAAVIVSTFQKGTAIVKTYLTQICVELPPRKLSG
jgi:hypothetical protein